MKRILLFLSAFLMLSAGISMAQSSVDLRIINPLPEIDFGDLATISSISGEVQRTHYFSISMINIKGLVVMEGEVLWKDNGKNDFRELYHFRTQPFEAQSEIRNEEIGKGKIRLDNSQERTNSSTIDENIKRGKPVGIYKFVVRIKGSDGSTILGEDFEEMEFHNFAPTISITSPYENETININEALQVQWTAMPGATKYTVRAAIKKNNQGIEDALNSPNPVINNRDAQNNTSITITRNMLDREWVAGQEIVLQVTAYEEGRANTSVKSNPVKFTIYDPVGLINQKDGKRKQELGDLINILRGLSANGDVAGLISEYINGDLASLDIKDESGRTLSVEELRNILLFLNSNPELIINIKKQ